MNFPTLKTNQLLRWGLKPEDAPRAQLLAGDREIADTTLTIPHPLEAEMAEQYVEGKISLYEVGKGVCFAVILAAEDVLVGVVTLKNMIRPTKMPKWAIGLVKITGIPATPQRRPLPWSIMGLRN